MGHGWWFETSFYFPQYLGLVPLTGLCFTNQMVNSYWLVSANCHFFATHTVGIHRRNPAGTRVMVRGDPDEVMATNAGGYSHSDGWSGANTAGYINTWQLSYQNLKHAGVPSASKHAGDWYQYLAAELPAAALPIAPRSLFLQWLPLNFFGGQQPPPILAPSSPWGIRIEHEVERPKTSLNFFTLETHKDRFWPF